MSNKQNLTIHQHAHLVIMKLFDHNHFREHSDQSLRAVAEQAAEFNATGWGDVIKSREFTGERHNGRLVIK